RRVLFRSSSRQMMNTSFNRLELVNTYGAFGSVGRLRPEIVFEGTSDETITAETRWREYEFKCKPGDVMRRPCVIAPYQERIDWQLWFAAMSTPEGYPWTLHLVWQLLHNDQGALSLLAGNPFPPRTGGHRRAGRSGRPARPAGSAARAREAPNRAARTRRRARAARRARAGRDRRHGTPAGARSPRREGARAAPPSRAPRRC